jgi:hypothetical protein
LQHLIGPQVIVIEAAYFDQSASIASGTLAGCSPSRQPRRLNLTVPNFDGFTMQGILNEACFGDS